MLIDIDNANYGKKDEEEEPSMVIERDPRLSDTLISSHPPARQSVSSTADNTLDLATIPNHAYEETITPNTCFDNYSSEELMALCAKYKKLVIAYEPVWAIGTGKTATAEQAQEIHAYIRQVLAAKFGAAAQETAILYGGSCKPSNAAEIFAKEDVDGGLIGGAALKAEDFLAIGKGFSK